MLVMFLFVVILMFLRFGDEFIFIINGLCVE